MEVLERSKMSLNWSNDLIINFRSDKDLWLACVLRDQKHTLNWTSKLEMKNLISFTIRFIYIKQQLKSIRTNQNKWEQISTYLKKRGPCVDIKFFVYWLSKSWCVSKRIASLSRRRSCLTFYIKFTYTCQVLPDIGPIGNKNLCGVWIF